MAWFKGRRPASPTVVVQSDARPIPRQHEATSPPVGEYTPTPPPSDEVVAPTWTLSSPTLRPEGYSRVVGESHRQEALHRHLDLAQPHGYVLAQLIRDRRNHYDSGAVAVFLGSDHVGYIPREELGYEGQPLYKALARLNRRGAPATAWARLTGGTPDKPTVGITLFTSCLGTSDEPYPFTLTVPPGMFARLLGAEDQQELLATHLGQREEILLGCSLTIADRNPARPEGGGPVLLAALDGIVVGGMSAADSAPRMTFVQALTDAGRPANAIARIRRSSGKRGGFICSVSTVLSDQEPMAG